MSLSHTKIAFNTTTFGSPQTVSVFSRDGNKLLEKITGDFRLPHPEEIRNTQEYRVYPNGWAASIIIDMLGREGIFEVGILHGPIGNTEMNQRDWVLCAESGLVNDQVCPGLTKSEVDELCAKIAALLPRPDCTHDR